MRSRVIAGALLVALAAGPNSVSAGTGSPAPSFVPSAPIVRGPPAPRPVAPIFAGDEWAHDRPPSPDAAFRLRPFDLPDAVPWRLLFPSGRWKGPAAATGPTDDAGLPMRRWVDERLYYTPTGLGIQALRRLDGYRLTGDTAYLESARRMADKLRELGVREGRAIWLPFPYDDRKAHMKAPWVNALGQACALALFSRLHRLSGDPADLEFAVGVFESFRQLRRVDGPWVSELDDDGYLWFEHYPEGLRGRVFNAHAYTVLALRDYWQETDSAEARRWLEGGLTTLREKGLLFRREGTWSWYNLRNPVAHANYHLFHIRQLRALAPASGDDWFTRLADVFVEDFTWDAAAPWRHRPRPSGPREPPPAPRPEPAPAPDPTSVPTPSPA